MRVLLSILGIGMLVAGCSTAGTTATRSPTPSPSPSPTPTPSPTPYVKYPLDTAAGSLVLRISSEGGFIAPSADLTRLPEWALFGDGRILVPGPAAQTDPAPLVPNVRQMQVTPAEIQKILAAADAAGLLGPSATYNIVGNPDAGSTLFLATVAGKTHLISANSLGGVPGPGGGGDPTVAAARAKLAAFETRTQDMSTFLGRSVDQAAVYVPTAVRLYISSAAPADPSNPAPKLAWPLSTDPASAEPVGLAQGVSCLAVTGTDLTTFLNAAKTATSATVWTAPSGDYSIQVRPLYPNESGC